MINMAAKLNKKHTVKISSYMNIKIKVLNFISKQTSETHGKKNTSWDGIYHKNVSMI